ncbi:c-type cytochrome biogenesis protein CcsB [Desulfitobacterium metallireducens]|uniref:Cytochrome C biogenesis protein ResC n=1 Tax=Desulfitobacterium metallireducens DSM 15288 TaxID=871968 RepID=W0EDF6_9FIRM|nr:c-type cytochrome biogenesis protein CcsB [Desulfitobacterium metallireducens]AHF07209.1 cytochrome C biogenesis protein ResC [Desulfitobacterium metallireducens DSM 15288]
MNETLNNLEVAMFYLMIIAYLSSTMLYWLTLVVKKGWLEHLATGMALLGLVGNTVALISRAIISQRPPLSNGYEFILTFCWGIVAVYLFAQVRYKVKSLGNFVIPIPLLLLLFIIMTMGPDERVASSIPPALKSQWLTFHVITAMLSYGAFAISFGLGLMYLLKSPKEDEDGKSKDQSWISRFPASQVLDELAYKIIGFAFPMLTLCIITGAIWANYAWGTYWSWDPKETWSLITWIIYAAYLHARLMYGWKGKRAAWLEVLGFIAVLFTFFGVNYLLPGLHSYA